MQRRRERLEPRERGRRMGPKGAEEEAGPCVWSHISKCVRAFEHMCDDMRAVDGCMRVLVLKVWTLDQKHRHPPGGWGPAVCDLTPGGCDLHVTLRSAPGGCLSERTCVREALGYLTCRWRFAWRHPRGRKLTPSSQSTPKSRAGPRGRLAGSK